MTTEAAGATSNHIDGWRRQTQALLARMQDRLAPLDGWIRTEYRAHPLRQTFGQRGCHGHIWLCRQTGEASHERTPTCSTNLQFIDAALMSRGLYDHLRLGCTQSTVRLRGGLLCLRTLTAGRG